MIKKKEKTCALAISKSLPETKSMILLIKKNIENGTNYKTLKKNFIR